MSIFDNQALFSIVPGAQCIVQQNGLYSQCEVYHRDGVLFGRLGTRFFRLTASGTTSNPRIRLESLILPQAVTEAKLGSLVLTDPGALLPPPSVVVRQIKGPSNE